MRRQILARFDGSVRVVRPLRPGAGIEPPAADARVLHDDEVVAGSYARATRRDDRRVRAVDPNGDETAVQLVDGQEATGVVDALARGQAPRAGDVTGARVERARLAQVALALAGVEHDVGGRVVGVLDRRDAVGRPRRRREALRVGLG